MKQRAKNGVPTIRLVKHVERSNFSMILYRIAKNLLQTGHRKEFGTAHPSAYYGAGRRNSLMEGFTQMVWGVYFNI